MVFAEEVEDFLGFSSLGEGGVAAQVTKYDDDLAAMAFKDVLVALRDDQLRQLRREEPLQSPDPTQFLHLSDDACFQFSVPSGNLLRARSQFAQQSRVLHRNNRLRGEILEESDLLIGEGPHF